jgi:hypothetical protein
MYIRESGFEAGTRNLRKCKKNSFFLQRASGGDQDRLGPGYSIGNTADSVFLQYSGG